MSAWAWGPFLAAVSFAWAGPRVLQAAHPKTAVQLAAVISLVVALSTGLVLAVAAELAFMQVRALLQVGTAGPWQPSIPALGLGAAAAAAVTWLLAAALRTLARSGRNLYSAWIDTRAMNPHGERVVIVDDALPTAFAVTGYPGQVVVTTGMLGALEPDEQAALLAHEDAHLRHNHQLYIQLAQLAAAANPLLRPLTGVIQTATERWADEEAAAAVGDRQLVARAMARAALASHRHQPRLVPAVSAAAGSATESQLAARIHGLMSPQVHTTRRMVAGVLVVLGLCLASSGTTVITGHQQVEHIEINVIDTGR